MTYTGVNGGTFPNTIPGPAAGEYVTHTSVGIVAQGAANECKYLYDTKLNLAGGTMTGAITFTSLLGGSSSVIESDGGIIRSINGGRVYLSGKVIIPAPQRLTDANATISVNDGPTVFLVTPTVARTITVEQATDAPINGQCIDFWLYAPGTIGTYYEIKREGSGNYIVRLTGAIGGNVETGHCRIQFEGGVWRLMGGHGLGTIGTDA